MFLNYVFEIIVCIALTRLTKVHYRKLDTKTKKYRFTGKAPASIQKYLRRNKAAKSFLMNDEPKLTGLQKEVYPETIRNVN